MGSLFDPAGRRGNAKRLPVDRTPILLSCGPKPKAHKPRTFSVGTAAKVRGKPGITSWKKEYPRVYFTRGYFFAVAVV